jgi:hypothetical protein
LPTCPIFFYLKKIKVTTLTPTLGVVESDTETEIVRHRRRVIAAIYEIFHSGAKFMQSIGSIGASRPYDQVRPKPPKLEQLPNAA